MALALVMSFRSTRTDAVWFHHRDVIMGTMASQITSLTTGYSSVYSGADQRKHQRSASLAFVWGIHRWPVTWHKWPVTRKMFLFHDVVMWWKPDLVHFDWQNRWTLVPTLEIHFSQQPKSREINWPVWDNLFFFFHRNPAIHMMNEMGQQNISTPLLMEILMHPNITLG